MKLKKDSHLKIHHRENNRVNYTTKMSVLPHNNRELFNLAKNHAETNDFSEKYSEKGSQMNKN